MYPRLLNDNDVKIVYDSQNVKREVIISFEKFLEIAKFLERHAYFYSPEVQEQLRKSDEDLEAGRYVEVKDTEIDQALAWLHE